MKQAAMARTLGVACRANGSAKFITQWASSPRLLSGKILPQSSFPGFPVGHKSIVSSSRQKTWQIQGIRMLSASPPGRQSILEVDEQNFVKEVIECSDPVIVCCIANWCRESASPIAQAVASTPGIKLAVMDVEKSLNFAAQLQIDNVPVTLLFHKRKAVDKIVGSMTEQSVRSLVSKAASLAGDKGPGPNEMLIQAGKLLGEGKVDDALHLYMAVAQASKENHGATAYAGMALCAMALQDVEAATGLVADIKKDFPGSLDEPIVKQACNAVEFASMATGDDTLEDLKNKLVKEANDHEARHALALALFGRQKYEEAIGHALEIVKRDKSWEDGKGRKLLFKFFDTLGNGHPHVISARKRLASLLF